MSVRPLILMSGLIGTGKSTTARDIAEKTAEFTVLSSSNARRELGINVYRKEDGLRVRRHIEKEAIRLIIGGRGVVLDTINNTYAHRKEDYDFAQELGLDALVIETQCSKALAKTRIITRGDFVVHTDNGKGVALIDYKTSCRYQSLDAYLYHVETRGIGVFADTSDPQEYDRVLRQRESFDDDLLRHPEMTYITLDTETNKAQIIKAKDTVLPFAEKLLVSLGYSITEVQMTNTT